MFRILVYVIFMVSVAMAAGGIILVSRLRTRYKSDMFSILLYYQVFIYTFGFYGIWGQVLINAFLGPVISPDLLVRFSDISMFLGLPFLIFAWLMLVRFSWSLSGRRVSSWFIFWFLFLNFTILTVVGYFITKRDLINSTTLMKDYFIIMNLIYCFLASYLIHFPWKGRSLVHDFDRRIISPAIFIIMIAQCIPLLMYPSRLWPGIIFILMFFAGNTFLPFYFNYGTLLSAFAEESDKGVSFGEFCRKFEVSPRESDIVREICNGLSNKEISEKLFISLQTVKDHTHHIYIKTNVKSRVQLINLVKEVISH